MACEKPPPPKKKKKSYHNYNHELGSKLIRVSNILLVILRRFYISSIILTLFITYK